MQYAGIAFQPVLNKSIAHCLKKCTKNTILAFCDVIFDIETQMYRTRQM